MSVWKVPVDVQELNQRWTSALKQLIGFAIVDVSADSITAVFPVNAETRQPFGALHGGVICYCAESLASMASNMTIGDPDTMAVGMALTASHVRPSFDGDVKLTVTLRHGGRKTQLWAYELRDQKQKLLSLGTVTMALTPRS